MKIITVTPIRYEREAQQLVLVSRVEFFGFPTRRRPKEWWSVHDITVPQLCTEVAARFGADEVNFQPPLMSLSVHEFHAADYL